MRCAIRATPEQRQEQGRKLAEGRAIARARAHYHRVLLIDLDASNLHSEPDDNEDDSEPDDNEDD